MNTGNVRSAGPGRGRLARTAGVVLLLAAAVALPFVSSSPYVLDVAILMLFYMCLALGLNVVVGYAGLLDLGYAAYFAVGAYTLGILTRTFHVNFWQALAAAGLFAMLLGLLIGMTVLRLRSDYLTMVTLGFGEIIRITANNLKITGGPTGIFGIMAPKVFGLSLGQPRNMYFVMLVLVVLTTVAMAHLGNSRVGRAWACLREDQDAAEAMGINTLGYKLLAYMTGTFWGGLTGAFFAVKMTAVSPNSFSFMQSVTVLMAVVMGGMGSVPGVILGGALVILLPELLRNVADWRYLVFGAALVLLMLFRPVGLWPARSGREREV
ncbi:branched-chain amino acid transport system permease protein [Symbiobacterium terraclitae]|uniref:Branched-chain amino acid transport system permease protein n=1 Tax=Symbiobacterium terraclitae TaxID=557451 RepID=A0ABS4JPL4_9FIRM|nr:branched-chain amino acid ABC transporter permease [Symbiobacterium terraclitae]MBP2017484.1 branched-chain amino acid transport system permease protein [Symbiobacterium terraclitae]